MAVDSADEFDEINLSKNTLLGAISTDYESMAFLSGTRSGFHWLDLHEVGGDEVDAIGEHQRYFLCDDMLVDDALYFFVAVFCSRNSPLDRTVMASFDSLSFWCF